MAAEASPCFCFVRTVRRVLAACVLLSCIPQFIFCVRCTDALAATCCGIGGLTLAISLESLCCAVSMVSVRFVVCEGVRVPPDQRTCRQLRLLGHSVNNYLFTNSCQS
jgi:hypothetical protein